MLAAPYATSLPDDPNIIPIDKVFQEPIGNATSILEGGKLLQLNPAVKSQKELFGQNQSVYCRILPLKVICI